MKLRHWAKGRVVNANARLLSFNSTTVPFTCHAGDTLSFYRELYWKNLVTGESDTAGYYSPDSLDYAIELVRLSDSARVATLDSVGILANTTPGPPRIHGGRPLLATVRYVVPPALEGTEAFMRVLVFHRGEGPYWFTRTDRVTIGYSAHATHPDWLPYWEHFLTVFNPTAPKTSVEPSLYR